jgi:hypothetical protein
MYHQISEDKNYIFKIGSERDIVFLLMMCCYPVKVRCGSLDEVPVDNHAWIWE